MCHQTVGLIARRLETAGIPTLSLTSAHDITAAVDPPRAAFLDFPLGHTSGRPNQPELNRSILVGALNAFESIDRPGTIADLPFTWAETDDWKDHVMRPRPASDRTSDDRIQRFPEPQYQTDADAAAATALHRDEQCLVCTGIDF